MADLNTPHTFVDGQIIQAAQMNANFDAVEAVVNDLDAANLSAGLAALLPAGVVSTLPGSPFDGQQVYFQDAAMASQGVVWHFRYRAGSASAYKWEFVGGQPLALEWSGSDVTSGATYGIVGASGAGTLTGPAIQGDFDIACDVVGHFDVGSSAEIGESALGDSSAANASWVICRAIAATGSTDYPLVGSGSFRATGQASSATYAAWHRPGAFGQTTITAVRLRLLPVRVSV